MEKLSNTAFKRFRLLKQKKHRDEQGVFIAEGVKCIQELLSAYVCQCIITTAEYKNTLNIQDSVATYEANIEKISQLSLLQHPQGIIAYFKLPDKTDFNGVDSSLLLALDGIQDPGNMGTIIRTADWFGIRDIICSKDTVDCFNPKVVQATMGSLSRVKIHYTDLVEYLSLARKQGTHIYGTLLDGKNIYEQQTPKSGIVVMGNEGNGLSSGVRAAITDSLYIPKYPKDAETIESLNVSVATALILGWCRSGEK